MKKILIVIAVVSLLVSCGIVYLNQVILPQKLKALIIKGIEDSVQKKVFMKTAIVPLKGILKTGRFLISYRIYENKGPQLICINGVQQTMAMWQTFISRFSRD